MIISEEELAHFDASEKFEDRTSGMKIKSNWMRACLIAASLAAAGCGAVGGAQEASSPPVTPAPPTAPAPLAPPILSMTSPSVDFGDVAVGTTTALEVTFSNTGGSSLSLQQTSVSGPGFTTSGLGSGVSLAPGQFVAVDFSFNPTATGNAIGVVALSSNASTMPVNISLSGNGIVATHSVALAWMPSSSSVRWVTTFFTVRSQVLRGSV